MKVRTAIAATILALAVTPATAASANRLYTIHVFKSGSGDGAEPDSQLVADGAGNYYGTTLTGGSRNLGTAFRLAPDGSVTTIYEFRGKSAGASPTGPLLMTSAGGVVGGARVVDSGGKITGSVIYSLSPRGRESVLHSFSQSDPAGFDLEGGLTPGPDGSLYGGTSSGGGHRCGTLFHLTITGALEILHDFAGGSDGCGTWSAPVLDAQGDLFGPTGGGSEGAGMIYKLASDGTYTILHDFQPYSQDDGGGPTGSLVLDAQGNLYGTTRWGNSNTAAGGTVYRIAADGKYRVLHAFSSNSDGVFPVGVIAGKDGNLYGATYQGGSTGNGTIYKLAPNGQETILHSFEAFDGALPVCPPLFDVRGNLLGTTSVAGGIGGEGTLYRLDRN